MIHQKQTFLTSVAATGDEPSIVISTAQEDRDGDLLQMRGCDLSNYRKNPVVLFAHDSKSLPIGAATQLDVTADSIRASWRWVEGDSFADRVRNCFDRGALRAASVGFRPITSEPRGGGKGQVFTRWELLEFSLVPVPSNPNAIRSLKAEGLWTKAVEKSGRVLSSLNQQHVEAALAHAEGCSDHLSQVLAALKPDDPDEEIDIDLTDDEEVEVDPADLKAALSELPGLIRDGLRAAIGAAVKQEVTRGLGRMRGRLDDDILMLDRIHHHHAPLVSAHHDIDINLDDIAAVMPGAVRTAFQDALREHIRECVTRSVNQLRGRLD